MIGDPVRELLFGDMFGDTAELYVCLIVDIYLESFGIMGSDRKY